MGALRVCLALMILAACPGCGWGAPIAAPVAAPIAAPIGGPGTQARAGYVHVEKGPWGFQLVRGGKPYLVKGVGMQTGAGTLPSFGGDFRRGMDLLVRSGGNSLRTWGSENAQAVLDEAHARGLTVMLGLWVAPQRQGMNYDDEAAVRAQLEGFRAVVRAFRGHPALLLWGVGNELELEATNPKVWPAVNEIARMIHQEDPDHPAACVTASYRADVFAHLQKHLGEIDILGVNAYAELEYALGAYGASVWDRPLLICEWGPTGWWEGPKTAWGACVEPASGPRAAEYASRYDLMERHRDRVLGSYAFYWGQKQERTSTWFNLVIEGGLLTESAGTLQEKWTGRPPANRAPHVTALTLQGRGAREDVQVGAGQPLSAQVAVKDPDGDALNCVWQVFDETTATSMGGDAEAVPREVTGLAMTSSGTSAAFTSPSKPGAYRLFVRVLDGQGNVGTANLPFRVP